MNDQCSYPCLPAAEPGATIPRYGCLAQPWNGDITILLEDKVPEELYEMIRNKVKDKLLYNIYPSQKVAENCALQVIGKALMDLAVSGELRQESTGSWILIGR